MTEKKDQIELLHREIQGHRSESSDGKELVIEGLKSKLQKSYEEIKQQIDSLEIDYKGIETNINKQFEVSQNSKQKTYEEIKKQIESLLPDALTAGLSHAYSKKREAEEKELINHQKKFNLAIFFLCCFSVIPIAISIFFLIQGDVTFIDVINKIPRIVSGILPLYFPVLWVAYSSSRKSNLSKRLIEEYSHKETLSKTFEGLSNQVENLGESSISKELKLKLLYNLLEVNSENPGKLIKDYNKTDHPIIDVLDKSIKLSNSVEALNKIPGLSKIVDILDRKSEKYFNENNTKANKGLDRTQGKKDKAKE